MTFLDGVSGIVDLKDFIQNGTFKVLSDKEQFDQVYINGEAIAWTEELEIDTDICMQNY